MSTRSGFSLNSSRVRTLGRAVLSTGISRNHAETEAVRLRPSQHYSRVLNMNKHNLRSIVLGVAVLGLGVSGAFAQATTFDPNTYTAQLAGASGTAVPIVGSLIALGAGIAIWMKVKGFFAKSK